MKQSTKRFTSSLLGLAFIIGSLVMFLNFVLPASSDAEAIRGEKVSREAAIKKQKEVVAKVKTILDSYREETQLAVSTVLPQNPDAGGAVSQISLLAQASGLSPQSFSVTPPAQAAKTASSSDSIVKPVGTYSIQVRATGSYPAFKEFIKSLETNMRLFELKTLAMQPVGKGAGQDMFIYDISVATFYQIQ